MRAYRTLARLRVPLLRHNTLARFPMRPGALFSTSGVGKDDLDAAATGSTGAPASESSPAEATEAAAASGALGRGEAAGSEEAVKLSAEEQLGARALWDPKRDAPRAENLWFMEEEYKDEVKQEDKEAVERLLSLKTASASEQLQHNIAKAIQKWRRHEADVGSPAVSIAAMSERIKHLHVHMRQNHKDKHSMYGINALINKRRYMLKYLAKKDFQAFKALMNEYEISTLELMTDQDAARRGRKERNALRRSRRGKRMFPPYLNAE